MTRSLTRDKYLSEPEIKKLRRACMNWDTRDLTMGLRIWMAVDLALTTGLRVGELSKLRIEDLDFNSGSIKVNRLKKKKRVTEYIPMPSKLANHLQAYLHGQTHGPILTGRSGALTFRGWQYLWKRACVVAGIRVLSIHKARHTAATVLYKHTHDIRLVQKQLGHASPATTAIYADVSFEDMQRASERMFDD